MGAVGPCFASSVTCGECISTWIRSAPRREVHDPRRMSAPTTEAQNVRRNAPQNVPRQSRTAHRCDHLQPSRDHTISPAEKAEPGQIPHPTTASLMCPIPSERVGLPTHPRTPARCALLGVAVITLRVRQADHASAADRHLEGAFFARPEARLGAVCGRAIAGSTAVVGLTNCGLRSARSERVSTPCGVA
jgi:hypothetical protein